MCVCVCVCVLLTCPPAVAVATPQDRYEKPSALARSARHVVGERKTRMPGYTGYIQHSQHVAGRPYARATARALNNGVTKLAVGDMVPSDPATGRKIPICGDITKTTTLVGKAQSTVKHVPGYTGHVANTRHRIGETYGRTTASVLKRPIIAKEDRKALNRASLERVSFPTSHPRPVVEVQETGLLLKYT